MSTRLSDALLAGADDVAVLASDDEALFALRVIGVGAFAIAPPLDGGDDDAATNNEQKWDDVNNCQTPSWTWRVGRSVPPVDDDGEGCARSIRPLALRSSGADNDDVAAGDDVIAVCFERSTGESGADDTDCNGTLYITQIRYIFVCRRFGKSVTHKRKRTAKDVYDAVWLSWLAMLFGFARPVLALSGDAGVSMMCGVVVPVVVAVAAAVGIDEDDVVGVDGDATAGDDSVGGDGLLVDDDDDEGVYAVSRFELEL